MAAPSPPAGGARHDAGEVAKPTVAEIVADLEAEHAALDVIVADRPPGDFARATPSPGWSVRDQVGHLSYFDHTATLAIVDPEAFGAEVTALIEALGRGEDPMAAAVARYRLLSPPDLLETWRRSRSGLIAAARSLDDRARLPWYGPAMGAVSFLSARLMETWAHGQDVADALGVDRPATDRLRHVAQLGVITRSWSYAVRGKVAPEVAVRVRLRAPSGATWQWQQGAHQSIEGDALDFCLVVTQRRNVADTGLVVEGEAAAEWMRLAQAFAGPPTEGPPPRAPGSRQRSGA